MAHLSLNFSSQSLVVFRLDLPPITYYVLVSFGALLPISQQSHSRASRVTVRMLFLALAPQAYVAVGQLYDMPYCVNSHG